MGSVYRARQTRPDRIVAIKVISPELARDDVLRARFEREATLVSQTEHPNVIPVYEVGEEDGLLFIAMRFVDGMDLRKLCALGGRFDPVRAARLIAQIAAALDAAHSSGLVHRDVTPANVLDTGGHDSEHLYLTDFGLAKRVVEMPAATCTPWAACSTKCSSGRCPSRSRTTERGCSRT